MGATSAKHARRLASRQSRDAWETAHALILMSEGFLHEKLGREPPGDWRRTVDTLATLWQRALFGESR
jgi:hypothetical protein